MLMNQGRDLRRADILNFDNMGQYRAALKAWRVSVREFIGTQCSVPVIEAQDLRELVSDSVEADIDNDLALLDSLKSGMQQLPYRNN